MCGIFKHIKTERMKSLAREISSSRGRIMKEEVF